MQARPAPALRAATPIVVLVFSHFFLGEGLTRQKIVGVILGFAGVTIVIFERGASASMEFVSGNVIIFVAVLAVVLLGQSIAAPFLIGGTIAIAGVAVAQFG